MARLDYYAVEEGIREVLSADADLEDVRIEIETDVEMAPDGGGAVYVYLDRRDAPASEQRLAAGTRTDFLLRFALWCLDCDFESVAAASRRRDDLLGKVEVALMRDRSLNGTVDASWLEGGEFLTMQEQGFISGGEIILIAKAKATT